MKNTLGTQENLTLYTQDKVKVYEFIKNSKGDSYEYIRNENGNILAYKDSGGYSYEYTYDKNGKQLTYKNSKGYSCEYTRDEEGNELTYKNSKGTRRGFDKSQSTQTERKLFPREMLVWDDDELILFKEVVIGYVQNKEFPWIVGSIKKGSDKYFGYKNAKEI